MVNVSDLKSLCKTACGLSFQNLKVLLEVYGKSGKSKSKKTGKVWTTPELFEWANKMKKTKKFITRLRELDTYSEQILLQRYKMYAKADEAIGKMNDKLKATNPLAKVIRRENFPSDISENLTKFAIIHHYKGRRHPTWQCSGDLDEKGLKIEVKAFSSTGPLSFGPKEEWDYIYFVDCQERDKFKVYELKLSNTSNDWRSIRVNKTCTYGDHCDSSRRPRHSFKGIRDQLRELGIKLRCIFNGPLERLVTKPN